MRLSKEIKDNIIIKLQTHTFGEKVEQHVKDRKDFAEKIYLDVYKSSKRKQMEALPKGWLPKSSSIGVQFGTSYTQMPFDGICSPIFDMLFEVGHPRSIMYHRDKVFKLILDTNRNGCSKVYDATHRLSEERTYLERETRDLQEKLQAGKAEVTAALNSVTTVKKLIEMWPEIEPFVPTAATATNLPALPVAKLNKAFGLPVKAA